MWFGRTVMDVQRCIAAQRCASCTTASCSLAANPVEVELWCRHKSLTLLFLTKTSRIELFARTGSANDTALCQYCASSLPGHMYKLHHRYGLRALAQDRRSAGSRFSRKTSVQTSEGVDLYVCTATFCIKYDAMISITPISPVGALQGILAARAATPIPSAQRSDISHEMPTDSCRSLLDYAGPPQMHLAEDAAKSSTYISKL